MAHGLSASLSPCPWRGSPCLGVAPLALGGAPLAPGGAPLAPDGAPLAPGGAPFAPGEAPPAPGWTLKSKVDHFLHCSRFCIAHFCTSLTLKFMLKVQYHWKVREMLQNDIHEVKSWI